MIRTGVVASVLMAMVAVGSAEAGPIRSQASGSFVAQGTPIDTNNDGTSADLFIVSVMKSPNMTSTIGRMPVIAAPTPMPA